MAYVGQQTKTYRQQICTNTGCNLEDLLGAMDDRDEWRERESRKSVLAARLDDNDDYKRKQFFYYEISNKSKTQLWGPMCLQLMQHFLMQEILCTWLLTIFEGRFRGFHQRELEKIYGWLFYFPDKKKYRSKEIPQNYKQSTHINKPSRGSEWKSPFFK